MEREYFNLKKEVTTPEIKLDTQLDKTLEKIRVEYKNDFRAFFEDVKKKSQSNDKSSSKGGLCLL